MATSIDVDGNTVEEAVEEALEKLGIDRDQAIIEILEEESKGFFRRTGGRARIRVTAIETGIEKTIDMIKEIMRQSRIEGDINVSETSELITLNITGNNLGILIGKRGDTLSAIQTIANVIQKKAGSNKKILIDVEGYRQRRVDSLVSMASRAADKVVKTGKEITLRPMNSYDRRMIHVALQENEKVCTMSEGDEPTRQIKIAPR